MVRGQCIDALYIESQVPHTLWEQSREPTNSVSRALSVHRPLFPPPCIQTLARVSGTSPKTNQKLPHLNLYPNREKESQIAAWKESCDDSAVQQQLNPFTSQVPPPTPHCLYGEHSQRENECTKYRGCKCERGRSARDHVNSPPQHERASCVLPTAIN